MPRLSQYYLRCYIILDSEQSEEPINSTTTMVHHSINMVFFVLSMDVCICVNADFIKSAMPLPNS